MRKSIEDVQDEPQSQNIKVNKQGQTATTLQANEKQTSQLCSSKRGDHNARQDP